LQVNEVASVDSKHLVLLLIERVVAVVLGAVLVASSLMHLTNPYYFLSSVYNYEIVDVLTGQWIAVVLPWLQLFCGALLISGRWVPPGFVTSAGLFAMFSGVQLSALTSELSIDCGCFGPGVQQAVSYWTLGLSSGLFLLALFGFGIHVARQGCHRANESAD
jgi:hypothetical protein